MREKSPRAVVYEDTSARAATAARAPQPDVALTPADAAGFPPDDSSSDSSDSSDYHSRWDAFDTYKGVRRHLDSLRPGGAPPPRADYPPPPRHRPALQPSLPPQSAVATDRCR